MQIILDHLSSILIAGIMILGLQVTQFRSQHSDIEQVASHSVKAKTLVFGEWVERDILDLGANFGTNVYRFEEPVVDADSNTTEWTFYSDGPNEDGDLVRLVKRYRLVPTNTAAFRDTTFQLYRLDRDEREIAYNPDGSLGASSSWESSGQSISTLSFFRIDLIDRFGVTPRDEDGDLDYYKTDYVRVRFGVVPEYVLRPDNYIRELYWSKTLKIRPYWVPPPSFDS